MHLKSKIVIFFSSIDTETHKNDVDGAHTTDNSSDNSSTITDESSSLMSGDSQYSDSKVEESEVYMQEMSIAKLFEARLRSNIIPFSDITYMQYNEVKFYTVCSI